MRESGVETFEWDGLALIERNGTKYINEPHPGGGNPILAIGSECTEAIFTDMLGTSLGTTNNEAYTAITKTSFGANSSDNSSFFTGKPYVENLGYAFLFRNYRADMGKWLSQDLIGYPDGWNNFAYCNNAPYLPFDFWGASWGNAEMLWHYQFGGGQYVSLSTMGLKDAVYSEITSNVITKLSNKIDGEIQKSIKSTSESSGYSTIYKDISVGHNFGHIVWAMGGGTVSARTNVSYSWVEYTEGDSVYRDYAWESYGTTIIYSDSFEQPLDFDNDGYPDVETGTPYAYGAAWTNQSIPGKSGKIYMRKADESEYE